jgi:hypothetical protein
MQIELEREERLVKCDTIFTNKAKTTPPAMELNNSCHKLKSINHFLHGIYQLLWISIKKHLDTMLEIEERMGVPLVHNISFRQSIEYRAISRENKAMSLRRKKESRIRCLLFIYLHIPYFPWMYGTYIIVYSSFFESYCEFSSRRRSWLLPSLH